MTGKDLVKFCESKLGIDYVYGMKGAVMTAERYALLKRMYPNAVWDSDSKKIGKVCVDCSGLIQWATGVAKNSSALKSEAAAAKLMYDIATINQAPLGSILWKTGHCGVYIGNGWCIEAKGSAYGVVKTKVSSTKWVNWLLPKYITYSMDHLASNTSASSSQTTSNQTTSNQSTGSQTTANSGTTKTFRIGDNVMVTGSLYSNRNGGNSIQKKNAQMVIVNIYNSGKYPIAFAKKGNRTVNGYGDRSVIK